MLEWLWQLLFPSKCILCGRILERGELDLCGKCRVDAPDFPEFGRSKLEYLALWTAMWYYEGNVRRTILRYKFRNGRFLAPSFGRLLGMKVSASFSDGFDLLTWVPVSSQRRFFRGYDQSELLARAVGAEIGAEPVRVLRKIRNNRPQSGMATSAERRANVLGAYALTDPAVIKGKRILLLDDVLTTGSTAGECARVLLTAGAKEVYLAALAAARHDKKKDQ